MSLGGFDPWEKDPFFPAAEEVQDSSDRMESVCRVWIQQGRPISGELRRELQTALGTAKWQLEELERAVGAYDEGSSAGEDMRKRHDQFIEAIQSSIVEVENSLRSSSVGDQENNLSWVRLDKGESDELARFLSGNIRESKDDFSSYSSANSSKDEEDRRDDRSTSLNDGSNGEECKISIATDSTFPSTSSGQSIPQKMLNFMGLINSMELTSKIGRYGKGFRKVKRTHEFDAKDCIPLTKDHLARGVHACYERSKGCLIDCDEDCCDHKQFYGWLGAIHRQLQRSQYQIQYGQPRQLIWVLLLVILIVLIATYAL